MTENAHSTVCRQYMLLRDRRTVTVDISPRSEDYSGSVIV